MTFRNLAFAYAIFSLLMIYTAYQTYNSFKYYDPIFAKRIVILAGLQSLSYASKSITLYPLGKYNDILTISKSKVIIAFIFSTIAFILLLIRYGYEMQFFYSLREQSKQSNDDTAITISSSLTQQIIILAFIFIIITIFNGATLVTLFQFYNKLDRFKIEAQNSIMSATAVSINPVTASAPYRIDV